MQGILGRHYFIEHDLSHGPRVLTCGDSRGCRVNTSPPWRSHRPWLPPAFSLRPSHTPNSLRHIFRHFHPSISPPSSPAPYDLWRLTLGVFALTRSYPHLWILSILMTFDVWRLLNSHNLLVLSWPVYHSGSQSYIFVTNCAIIVIKELFFHQTKYIQTYRIFFFSLIFRCMSTFITSNESFIFVRHEL